MSGFKFSNPLLVLAFFGVILASFLLAYICHSIYQFCKALEYEIPVDIEAQVSKTCPTAVEPVKPSATYYTKKIGHGLIRKVFGHPLLQLDQSSHHRSTHSASVVDESFTCIDNDDPSIPKSVYDVTPRTALWFQAETFRQPHLEDAEKGIPSPFDIYVSSRRPQISKEIRTYPRSVLPTSRPTPPTDVWWLAANVTVKPIDSEQKPILTNPKDHVYRQSTATVLGDISNTKTVTTPVLLVTPPTPKKCSKWPRKLHSAHSINLHPVMKSLKAQGRKPPDRRPQLAPGWSVEKTVEGGIPIGYF